MLNALRILASFASLTLTLTLKLTLALILTLTLTLLQVCCAIDPSVLRN